MISAEVQNIVLARLEQLEKKKTFTSCWLSNQVAERGVSRRRIAITMFASFTFIEAIGTYRFCSKVKQIRLNVPSSMISTALDGIFARQ